MYIFKELLYCVCIHVAISLVIDYIRMPPDGGIYNLWFSHK